MEGEPQGIAPEIARAAALAAQALTRLAEGDVLGALRAIDMRCHRDPPPEAPHWTLRAACLAQLGETRGALRDLDRALGRDPWYVEAALRRLALADDTVPPADRRAAAHVLLTDPAGAHVGPGAEALIALGDAAEGSVLWSGLARTPHVSARMLLRGLERPRCTLVGPGPTPFALGVVRLWQGGGHALWEACGPDLAGPATLVEEADGGLTLHVGFEDAGDPVITAEATVIVPLYEDAEATRACLEALASQISADPGLHLVLVDDASPNPSIRALLEEMAGQARITVLRNAVNRGFIGAVNRALACIRSGGVLLLNADTLPPAGLVRRLAGTARSGQSIGTVTPLSNTGEAASFPIPHAANAIPAWASAMALDAIAARVNRGEPIDMPNGVGFCLYVTRACLDAVGGLPETLARGYGEDVVLGLEAHRLGFRNVCDPSVFVAHRGHRSFGPEKPGLVARNLAAITHRFPTYRARYAVFAAKDPLGPARARIARALGPGPDPLRLLVCGDAVSEAAARERAGHAEPGVCAVVLRVRRIAGETRITLDAQDGAPPVACPFRSEDLIAYLDRARIAESVLLDADACPAALRAALAARGPLTLAPVVAAPGEARAADRPGPSPPGGVRRRIGWILPSGAVGETRWLVEIAEAWARQEAPITVLAFGRPFDPILLEDRSDVLPEAVFAGAWPAREWPARDRPDEGGADRLALQGIEGLVLGTRLVLREHPILARMTGTGLPCAGVCLRGAEATRDWFALDPGAEAEETAARLGGWAAGLGGGTTS